MTTQRLKSYNRQRILDRLMGQFEKEEADIKHKENLIADSAYIELFKPSVIKKMEELPEGWLPTQSWIYVRIEGQSKVSFDFIKPRRYPAMVGMRLDKPSEDLINYCKNIQKQKAELFEKKRGARQAAEVIINSVTTMKRLIEIWPEIESIVKEIGFEPSAPNLPAVQVDKLNTVLGLPIEEQAA